MNPLAGILKDPISGILGAVGDVIGKFVASPEDKLKAQLAVTQATLDFNLKVAELDGEWAKTQAGVITSEVKSDSWMARNWRPILMLTFTYIILHTYVLAPLFSIRSVVIPPDMWELLKLGIGGYVIGRSAEKITPAVVGMLAKKDDSGEGS